MRWRLPTWQCVLLGSVLCMMAAVLTVRHQEARWREALRSHAHLFARDLVAQVTPLLQNDTLLQPTALHRFTTEPGLVQLYVADAQCAALFPKQMSAGEAKQWEEWWQQLGTSDTLHVAHRTRDQLLFTQAIYTTGTPRIVRGYVGLRIDINKALRSVRGSNWLGSWWLIIVSLIGGGVAWWLREQQCFATSPAVPAQHASDDLLPCSPHWAVNAADVMPDGVAIFDVMWRLVALNAEAKRWFAHDREAGQRCHVIDVAAQLPWGEALLATVDQVSEVGPLSFHSVASHGGEQIAIAVARLEADGVALGYWVTSHA